MILTGNSSRGHQEANEAIMTASVRDEETPLNLTHFRLQSQCTMKSHVALDPGEFSACENIVFKRAAHILSKIVL